MSSPMSPPLVNINRASELLVESGHKSGRVKATVTAGATAERPGPLHQRPRPERQRSQDITQQNGLVITLITHTHTHAHTSTHTHAVAHRLTHADTSRYYCWSRLIITETQITPHTRRVHTVGPLKETTFIISQNNKQTFCAVGNTSQHTHLAALIFT